MEKAAQQFLMAANHPPSALDDLFVALIIVMGFIVFLAIASVLEMLWRFWQYNRQSKRRAKYLREISLLDSARLADEYEEASRRG